MSLISLSAAAVLCLSIGFSLATSGAQRSENTAVLVAILMISGQLFLPEQSIYGLPMRVIIFTLALVFLFSRAAIRRAIISVPEHRSMAMSWIFYCMAISFSFYLNGGIVETGDLADIISRYGYALIAFLSIGIASSTLAGASRVGVWLGLIGVVNIVFAMLQTIGIDAAIDIQRDLFPLTHETEIEMIAEKLISSVGYAPGLSAFSITAGYAITCLPMFLLAIGQVPGRVSWTKVGLAGLVVLVGGTLIISRSTLVFGGLGIVMYVMLTLRTVRANVVVVVCGALALVALVAIVQPLTEAFLSLVPRAGRLNNFEDQKRGLLLAAAFENFLANPFVGSGGQGQALLGSTVGAHNFVLNGLMLFGLVGVVPMMAVILVALKIGWRSVAASRGTNAEGLSIASLSAATMYLGKSLVHNESVATNGIVFMMLMAISAVGFNEHRKVAARSFEMARSQSRRAP